MDGNLRFRQILGIRFLVGNAPEVIGEVTRKGGLVVVPSGPGLKSLPYDERYRRALLGADFAIADSALMVLLWNFIKLDRVPKLSGLRYMRTLIEQPEFRKPGTSFWVMPSSTSALRNRKWLMEKGVEVAEDDFYLAPMYGQVICDPELLRCLTERRPRHIILGVGSNVQEPLGFYLKENLDYRPTIHCIGAAIAFLSGDQVRIPAWVDHAGFGWLWRCLSNPRRYLPRYWDARYLVPLILRYRDRMPVTNP
jgi:UDP-N-acetyl-D-mannosaminuronic acid transferase (WecB/TagA/CpsF family)